jgi:hypothetical protein
MTMIKKKKEEKETTWIDVDDVVICFSYLNCLAFKQI